MKLSMFFKSKALKIHFVREEQFRVYNKKCRSKGANCLYSASSWFLLRFPRPTTRRLIVCYSACNFHSYFILERVKWLKIELCSTLYFMITFLYLPTFSNSKREIFILGVPRFFTTTRLYTKMPEDFGRRQNNSEIAQKVIMLHFLQTSEISGKVLLFTHFIWTFRFSRWF